MKNHTFVNIDLDCEQLKMLHSGPLRFVCFGLDLIGQFVFVFQGRTSIPI